MILCNKRSQTWSRRNETKQNFPESIRKFSKRPGLELVQFFCTSRHRICHSEKELNFSTLYNKASSDSTEMIRDQKIFDFKLLLSSQKPRNIAVYCSLNSEMPWSCMSLLQNSYNSEADLPCCSGGAASDSELR